VYHGQYSILWIMTFLENQLKRVQFYRDLKKLSASVGCDYSTLSVFRTGEEQLADYIFLDYGTGGTAHMYAATEIIPGFR
jgi:hypothetical protein